MACDPNVFAEVPIFSLLDADERAILADHVELRRFVGRQRIYRVGDPGSRAYIVLTGRVEVSMVDDEQRPVVVDTPQHGELFGLSSMLAESPHLTTAVALDDTSVIEIDRNDIAALLQRKPMAGLDMLTMVGKQFRAAQELVRVRAVRNPNEEIAEAQTMADRVADSVARFGGSWRFIGSFVAGMVAYIIANQMLPRPWDPYPYILLNLFLSMLAAFQAPVIMMSQNRQDAKDRLRGELDYRVNLKAEVEISRVPDRVDLDPRVGLIVEHVPLADVPRARHGEGAAATAHPPPEVAGRRGGGDEVRAQARGGEAVAAPVSRVQDRLALGDGRVALAEGAPGDEAALDHELGLDPEELGPPEHDVGDLSGFERAHPPMDAVRAGGIDRVLREVLEDARVVVRRIAAAGGLHLVGELPGAADRLADPAHALGVG